ncbi:MAG: tyrosine--tRNA ligase, partial [Chitinophagales bacterium]
EHQQDPGQRILQKALAKDITTRVHSNNDLEAAVRASRILFGQSTEEELHSLSDRDFEEIFEGVPTKKISRALFDDGVEVIQLLVDETNFFPSKSEARRTIQSHGASVNKQVISPELKVKSGDLINNRYLLLQKGKKNYFLVIAE